jgi:hypothetical protein
MIALAAGVIVWFVLGMALGNSFDFQALARHPQTLLLVCAVPPVVEEIIFRGGCRISCKRACAHDVRAPRRVTAGLLFFMPSGYERLPDPASVSISH